MDKTHEKIRLDKWLWAARFFKTRALATDAINGGKVHVNDGRAKPSRPVLPNDRISISKGPYKSVVQVLALASKRGPAKEAALLYQETEASIQARQLIAEQLRANNLHAEAGRGRPTKKNRRKIISFTGN